MIICVDARFSNENEDATRAKKNVIFLFAVMGFNAKASIEFSST